MSSSSFKLVFRFSFLFSPLENEAGSLLSLTVLHMGAGSPDVAGADSTNHIGSSPRNLGGAGEGKTVPSSGLVTPNRPRPHAMEQMSRQLELCWIWQALHLENSIAVDSLSVPCLTPTACL